MFSALPPPPRLQEGTSRSWSSAEGPEERLRLRLLVPHSLVPLLIGKVRSAGGPRRPPGARGCAAPCHAHQRLTLSCCAAPPTAEGGECEAHPPRDVRRRVGGGAGARLRRARGALHGGEVRAAGQLAAALLAGVAVRVGLVCLGWPPSVPRRPSTQVDAQFELSDACGCCCPASRPMQHCPDPCCHLCCCAAQDAMPQGLFTCVEVAESARA